MVWAYHTLTVHLLKDIGAYLTFLVIMNKAAVNICVPVFA